MLNSTAIVRNPNFFEMFDKGFSNKRFYEDSWQKWISRANIPDFGRELIRERSLTKLLRSGSIPKSRIQVLKDGMLNPNIGDLSGERKYHLTNDFIGVERVQKLVESGYSVKIVDAFEYGENLNRFVKHLAHAFKCKVSNNLYYTPKNSACLTDHVDPYDIFVVQISGEKTWNVKNPKTDQYETFRLKEDDVLYLPRVSHYCATTDSDSLHLTFGLHPYNLNDILTDALISVEESGISTNAPLLPGTGYVGLDARQADQIMMLIVAHLKGSLKKVSNENY